MFEISLTKIERPNVLWSQVVNYCEKRHFFSIKGTDITYVNPYTKTKFDLEKKTLEIQIKIPLDTLSYMGEEALSIVYGLIDEFELFVNVSRYDDFSAPIKPTFDYLLRLMEKIRSKEKSKNKVFIESEKAYYYWNYAQRSMTYKNLEKEIFIPEMKFIKADNLPYTYIPFHAEMAQLIPKADYLLSKDLEEKVYYYDLNQILQKHSNIFETYDEAKQVYILIEENISKLEKVKQKYKTYKFDEVEKLNLFDLMD